MDIAARKLRMHPSYSLSSSSANYATALIHNQSADIAITEPSFNWRRYQKADFSSPIMERGLRIQYRKPKEVN